MSDLSTCEAVYEVRGFGCPDGTIRCEQPGPHDMHVNWTHCRTGHTWFDAKPTTREQIRVTAIERIARADFSEDREHVTWEATTEDQRQMFRDHAARLVDALGDLLPTGREWGVRYESVDYPPRISNPSGVSTNTRVLDGGEMHARAAVANGAPIGAENRRVVSRYSHDWIEVTE